MLIKVLCFVPVVALLADCSGTSNECSSPSDCPSGYVCNAPFCVKEATSGDHDVTPHPDDDGGGDPGTDEQTPGDASSGDAESSVTVDLVGPTIDIERPGPMQMVAGVITIRAVIDDPSGIVASSVVFVVGNNPDLAFVQEPRPVAGGFEAVFDTAQVDDLGYPTIQVTASDELGNVSSAGHEFVVDNTAPVLSLWSPRMQAIRIKNDIRECSRPFAPLGASAVRHGDVVDRSYTWGSVVFYPRGWIEDFGNRAFVSGVDPSTTKLYVLSKKGIDKGIRLVVGNGPASSCRGISPQAEPDPARPSVGQALVVDLVAVPGAGKPDFSGPSSTLAGCPCLTPGSETESPDLLCKYTFAAEGITFWPVLPVAKVPFVYVLTPYAPDSPVLCSGAPFDARNIDSDGPACLAAFARDNVGNAGVSAPIAICVDRDGTGDECKDFDAAAADAVARKCTDGCVAPDFGAATATVGLSVD